MSDLDLARRAVACPRWRWMEGMRIAAPAELLGLRVVEGSIVSPAALPDLDDPATIGCLLALVREAWSRPFLCALYTLDGHWYVHDMGASFSPHLLALEGIEAPSEAAALVAALESAP